MTLGKKSLTALTVASIALIGAPAATLAATSGASTTHHAVKGSPDRPGQVDRSRDRSAGSGDRVDTRSQDRSGTSIDRSGKSVDRRSNSVDRSGNSPDRAGKSVDSNS